jgi:peptidoglycan-associated lipoprotein
MKKLMLSAVLLGLLAGCASTGTEQKAAVEDKSMTKAPAKTADTMGTQQQGMAVNPLTDPNNILSKRSVYFDFDSVAVKDEYRPMVEAHAKYLTDHSSAKVTIQGNTDERGSREYNLALGQRRADAVKKVMSVLGVGDKQIETVSFGEEKPKATGNNEEAWAQNRRADIVYQGE